MSIRYAALNRFGLGAHPGQARTLDDPRGWLEAQLDGGPPPLAAPVPDDDEAARVFQAYRRAARARDRDALEEAVRGVTGLAVQESSAVLTTRVVSARPFVERWIAFWSNHLCVSAAAGLRVRAFAGGYERQVIRRYALGRFDEMVLASARHPGMLLYLDNAQSVGPESRLARRPRRGGAGGDRLRGLNENYARELLELHTVGVDGGYTQDDLVALARIFTGWTVSGLGGPLEGSGRRMGGVGFRFLAPAHDPGSKTVLGRRYGAGPEAGVEVIRDLCRRPDTARFAAGKLARHFIADDPPAAAVDALAHRWLETEGDLREVARTLIRLDEAWAPEHRKFRTPQDWLVALLRAVHAREAPRAVVGVLRQLRHPLWAPPSPAGYSDLERDWGDPDSLMNRAELARSVADRIAGGGGIGARVRPGRRAATVPDPRFLATVVDSTGAPGDALAQLLSDESIPVTQRLALGFAGPAFQWR